MGCFHPLPAWRTHTGEIQLTKEPNDSYTLRLPCGNCLGCRRANAKAWALRCQLEMQNHEKTVWTTLTYDESNRPPTLDRNHLSKFLKRLRRGLKPNRTVRFFASGEYGERTQRPHYHAILYGLAEQEQQYIEDKWGLGHTRTTPCTPATIAYTAGYTSKKIGYKLRMVEQVDPTTGEVYEWQPPFIQMSRRPGIGGEARKWAESWRLYAVQDGHKMPVPRFLHEAWKQQATQEEKEILLEEKAKLALNRDTTIQALETLEQQAIKQQELSADRRKY